MEPSQVTDLLTIVYGVGALVIIVGGPIFLGYIAEHPDDPEDILVYIILFVACGAMWPIALALTLVCGFFYCTT